MKWLFSLTAKDSGDEDRGEGGIFLASQTRQKTKLVTIELKKHEKNFTFYVISNAGTKVVQCFAQTLQRQATLLTYNIQSRNQTWVALVRDECSRHYVTLASH